MIERIEIEKPEKINRLAVKLKPASQKHIRNGHPWVFDESIAQLKKEGDCGDLTIIYDRKSNKFLALGLYDPHSPIRIKVISTSQIEFNQDWLREKLSVALRIRHPLIEEGVTGFRWVHGENDGLPSFVLDIYANVGVLKLYSGIWFPYLQWIRDAILAIFPLDAIVLRTGRKVAALKENKIQSPVLIHGTLDSPQVEFEEYGVKFIANVLAGHKTGFFLDHRDNRKVIGMMAKGKSVLDVFSYAGGFSVHALVGGAKEVVSLDISKAALDAAREHAVINQCEGNHKVIQGDAFEVLKTMVNEGKKFDIVVIDPPSMAKSQKEISKAENAYSTLAKFGAQLVAGDGVLMLASCSSRISADRFFEINDHVLSDHLPNFKLLRKNFHDIDHPTGFPEGAYLKCGYYSV